MLSAYACSTTEIAHSMQMMMLCSCVDSNTMLHETHTMATLMYEPHDTSTKSCTRNIHM